MDLTSPWLILLLPLASAVLITLFTQRWPRLSAGLSIAAVAGAFAVAASHLGAVLHGENVVLTGHFTWLAAGGHDFHYGYLVDGLSMVMLMVVTGVGGLIHVYATGYMKDDPGYARFFAYMSLFMFSMLGIVLADNLFQIFIHWELVGVSSYLLIGFYYRKDSASAAANKAFLTNRVGDFGFMLGILMLYFATRSATGSAGAGDFQAMAQAVANPAWLHAAVFSVGGGHWTLTNEHFLWIAGALTFMGIMGKSAQFPLHVWLPDAMEGPTPVSALIHAATMVAAGVFLLGRLLFIYMPSPTALSIVAHVGAFTAFFAATIATTQFDIKRVLAFSTLSQLGYMVMAMGLRGTDAAMFHLTTHAFFKALLFLGAGAVIHAVHTNDVREMGGLIRKLPFTGWMFVIATLALCGVPPLSGFWSKDGILHLTEHPPGYAHTWIIMLLPTITAVLTSYYMTRLVLLTFFGPPRDHHRYDHAHEAPLNMTLPMAVLCVLSVIGGPLLLGPEVLEHFRAITRPAGVPEQHYVALDAETALHALVIFGLGAGSALLAFGLRVIDPDKVKAALGPVYRFIDNRWYIDELYAWIVKNVQQNVARLCDAFDRYVIIGTVVNGSAWTTRAAGSVVARFQTGSVRAYALLFLAGVAALLALNL
ncbi:MAG TPA: NADH-quinone oxidoreductase subunit L [Planctomycetota bacterium]|nr:NADH-quinone oxidoreductase subunit L [Planctomycetota bacterium]